MRVAIITENFLPKVDGVTRTLARLLEHLEANGHEALVLGPESGMQTYAGAQLVGTAGIPFPLYPELKLNLWRPLFIRKLMEFQPDILHFVDPVWLGAAGLAASYMFFSDIPTVSSYHTNLAAYAGHFGWGFLTPFMWAWNRLCHSQCALTFCPSRSTSLMLRKQGFRNVRIWPRGVDISLFSPSCRSLDLRSHWLGGAPADSKIIILYVGRVSFEKNLGIVIQAYKKMDHDRCHLVVVGHGPALEEIQDEFALSETPVTFTGYLQGRELATAYASADIFAFPSTTETFGQVVLESMASGLPVVGLNAEGVCDLVVHEETGLLLDVEGMERAEQYEAYRMYLTRLVEDKEARKRMSEAAIKDAQGHTWAEAMEKLVSGYRDVVAKSRRGIRERKLLRTAQASSEDSGVEEDYDEGFEGSVEGQREGHDID